MWQPYNLKKLGLISIIATAIYLKLLKKLDHSYGTLNPPDGFLLLLGILSSSF